MGGLLRYRGSRRRSARQAPERLGRCLTSHSDPGTTAWRRRDTGVMPTYSVNERAVRRARQRIDSRQYVLESDWGAVQPNAEAENRYLKTHSWEEYCEWHLGLTDGARDGTKARYAFIYGDFRRVHRSGIIACHYRAAEWRHKAIELAAHDLLQYLDRVAGIAR